MSSSSAAACPRFCCWEGGGGWRGFCDFFRRGRPDLISDDVLSPPLGSWGRDGSRAAGRECLRLGCCAGAGPYWRRVDGRLVGRRVAVVVRCCWRGGWRWCVLDDDDLAKPTMAVDLLDLRIAHCILMGTFALASGDGGSRDGHWDGVENSVDAIEGQPGWLGEGMEGQRMDGCLHCGGGWERRNDGEEGDGHSGFWVCNALFASGATHIIFPYSSAPAHIPDRQQSRTAPEPTDTL